MSVLKSRVLYDIASIIGNGLGLVKVWGVFLVVWGGLGIFNGPHDGYANSKVKIKFANKFVSRCR